MTHHAKHVNMIHLFAQVVLEMLNSYMENAKKFVQMERFLMVLVLNVILALNHVRNVQVKLFARNAKAITKNTVMNAFYHVHLIPMKPFQTAHLSVQHAQMIATIA